MSPNFGQIDQLTGIRVKWPCKKCPLTLNKNKSGDNINENLEIGPTAVSDIKFFSVTLKTWRKEHEKSKYY